MKKIIFFSILIFHSALALAQLFPGGSYDGSSGDPSEDEYCAEGYSCSVPFTIREQHSSNDSSACYYCHDRLVTCNSGQEELKIQQFSKSKKATYCVPGYSCSVPIYNRWFGHKYDGMRYCSYCPDGDRIISCEDN